ncbi:hypothetical protein [Stutzerimonas nitrititolerans]|uniref:hypothetical protein n=1 Tax=Stutzerimonas nitrititolerans TaxID=2482751 RepID=UPI0028B093FC|nr:hypothetical protein [Stutzerimonas nitrititolerans]
MIDPEQIRKLSPRDGDILVLPANTTSADIQAFADALRIARPGIKATLIQGELQQLDEAAMNAAGWYRK